MDAFRMTDMDLIVWRHADAGDAEADAASDAGRRLTERGRKQAERMARWLQARLPERYTVLSSPHIDKKARQQFEIRTHKRVIDIMQATAKTIEALNKLSLPAGVDIKIKASSRR